MVLLPVRRLGAPKQGHPSHPSWAAKAVALTSGLLLLGQPCLVGTNAHAFTHQPGPARLRPRCVALHAENPLHEVPQEDTAPLPHAEFLAMARARGVDDALNFAAESMPQDFCRYYSQMRKAAKFMAKKSAKVERKAEKKRMEDDPSPSASTQRASPSGSATLRVCSKCVVRAKRKGSTFDPMTALQQLSGDDIVVESVPCIKYCKWGPNAEVALDSRGLGPAESLEGMTDQEKENRCFHQLVDQAACARVVEAARKAVAPAGSTTTLVQESPVTLASPPAKPEEPPPDSDEKAKRAKYRAGIRRRLEQITAGIDEDDL